MPIYTHECAPCGEYQQGYFPLTTSTPPSCTKCGKEMERTWSRPGQGSATGYPYVTKNLDPSGKPIEVRSALHEAELCKQFGMVKRDDTAWLEKEYLGYDTKSKKQRYSEGSGRGLPGQWV